MAGREKEEQITKWRGIKRKKGKRNKSIDIIMKKKEKLIEEEKKDEKIKRRNREEWN